MSEQANPFAVSVLRVQEAALNLRIKDAHADHVEAQLLLSQAVADESAAKEVLDAFNVQLRSVQQGIEDLEAADQSRKDQLPGPEDPTNVPLVPLAPAEPTEPAEGEE